MEDLNGAAQAAAEYVVLPEEAATALDDHGRDPAAEALEAEISGEKSKPRRRSPQERIDEVTRARREAERERDYWREEAERALHHQAVRAAAPPDPRQFPHGPADPGFVQAMGQHAARQEFQRLTAEMAHQAHAHAEHQAWTGCQQAFAEGQPDYFDALHEQPWACSQAMADAIRSSDEGAAVAYHLARNPGEAQRLFGLKPLAQIREIGRLEAKLARGSNGPAISGAPTPAPFARGTGGRFKIDPATGDFAAFEKQYGGA
jgi:hypothetical protein